MAYYFESVRDYLVSPADRKGLAFVPACKPAGKPRPDAHRPEEADNSLLQRLREFFAVPGNFARLKGYLGKDPEQPSVSLRILDFLCSDNGLSLEADRSVSDSYQHMLKVYSKGLFDVFARGERLDLRLGDEVVTTTVGQMNFFRWAIQVRFWWRGTWHGRPDASPHRRAGC